MWNFTKEFNSKNSYGLDNTETEAIESFKVELLKEKSEMVPMTPVFFFGLHEKSLKMLTKERAALKLQGMIILSDGVVRI